MYTSIFQTSLFRCFQISPKMGCAAKKNRVRSAHCNRAAKATSISGHAVLKHNDDCNGRNPFFQFLAHFRKCSNNCLGHLSSGRVTLIASKVWNCMSLSERKPFIAAARRFNYTYRSRSKKVNWVLEKLRKTAAGEECRPQAQWMLMDFLKSWQESVVRDLIDYKQN
ncbi:uncharacterized protein LOC6733594 [Drosophila simulans]|uniref:Uncharacterized protein n=1 Tax=Drosophila simulans TaxID=7240 RepID=A0A0J9R8C6_DROSI|nr:uncharacterized protein LOC6733594 [Drosophila simulans]KMY92343.1 uncharacterized protein Dsimw501_GD10139 [Drosophila simulans]